MPSVPSILPQLYDWSFWVPIFFRAFLAYQLIKEAFDVARSGETRIVRPGNGAPTIAARRTLVAILGTFGTLLLVGLGTQVVATIVACMFLVRIFQLGKDASRDTVKELLWLSSLVALSLLFLGPGPFSVDLPL